MRIFFRIFLVSLMSLSYSILLADNPLLKNRTPLFSGYEQDSTKFSSNAAVFVISTENYSENSFAAGDIIIQLNGVELKGEYQTIQDKMRRLSDSDSFSGTVIRDGKKVKVRETNIHDERKSFRYGLVSVAPTKVRTSQVKEEIDSLLTKIAATYVKFDEKHNKRLTDYLDEHSALMLKETMPIEIYFRMLLEISAVFNDGHMGVFSKSLEDTMSYRFVKKGVQFFPLSILLKNDRCYYEDQGAQFRIHSINGAPISTIINNMKKMVPFESEHYVESEIEHEFWFYYYLLYGPTRYFLITVFDENEKYSRKTLPGIFYSKIIKNGVKKKYDFKILEDTAFLTINSFAYDYLSSYGYKNFLKQSFENLRDLNIGKLVIDIHNNRGGSTGYAELLLRYLTTKPLSYWSQTVVRKSELAEKCGYSFEKGMKYGEVREYNRFPSELSEKPGMVFDGKTVLVVGKHCFSTSFDFAVAFKNAGLGKVVGEKTGGVKSSSEAQVSYKLPMSGLAFMIPGKYYISSGDYYADDGTFNPDAIIDLSDQQGIIEQFKDF